MDRLSQLSQETAWLLKVAIIIQDDDNAFISIIYIIIFLIIPISYQFGYAVQEGEMGCDTNDVLFWHHHIG